MSYVIQNFPVHPFSQNFNIRLRTLWLLRNTNMLVLYFTTKISLFKKITPNLAFGIRLWPAYNAFFRRSPASIMRSSINNTRTLVVNNLSKSLFYWFIKTSSVLLDSLTTSVGQIEETVSFRGTRSVPNTYYYPIRLSGIALTGKYYRTAMFHLILSYINGWSVIGDHYKTYYNFPIVTPFFQLIRFYNNYFFKVLHF